MDVYFVVIFGLGLLLSGVLGNCGLVSRVSFWVLLALVLGVYLVVDLFVRFAVLLGGSWWFSDWFA